MRIEQSHNLTIDEAKKRIQNLLTNLQKEHSDKISNVDMIWVTKNKMEYNMSIMGSGVTGQIILENNLVIIEGNVPLRYIMFSSVIENIIKQELVKLLL